MYQGGTHVDVFDAGTTKFCSAAGDGAAAFAFSTGRNAFVVVFGGRRRCPRCVVKVVAFRARQRGFGSGAHERDSVANFRLEENGELEE